MSKMWILYVRGEFTLYGIRYFSGSTEFMLVAVLVNRSIFFQQLNIIFKLKLALKIEIKTGRQTIFLITKTPKN